MSRPAQAAHHEPTRISAGSMFFTKRVFPAVWFGFMAFFLATTFWTGAVRMAPVAVAIPGVMAVFGFLLFRKLLWDLADEVLDGGDVLVVRFGHDVESIALANIINVSATTMVNPPRITLRLATPCRFGEEIAFSPVRRWTLNPFARNEIAEDLIVRVDAARRR
jgi:hypothetical protein